MHSLPIFYRIAGRPVIVLGDGEAAAAKRRLVERAGGIVVGADDREAHIALVALDDPEGAVLRLKARDVLVNVADRPELCDFTLPSVLDRDPVLIAVSTGGASAGLAKALRLRLETLLPASLGKLALTLHAARTAMKRRWPDAGDRRRALDEALGAGGALDPFADASAASVEAWLGGAEAGRGGLVEIVLASDDPDDLTLRQSRWLGSADRVFHAAGVSAAVLARARADAQLLALDDGDPPAGASGLTVVIRRG